MTSNVASPLLYHRSRRDHQLRMFFSAASRSHNGKPLWIRNQGGGRKGIVAILSEAMYHAKEVARLRELEWPEIAADEADLAMLGFLEEIQAWFHLLEHLTPGGDDPRPGITPLLESRIRVGLRLFHTSRHVQSGSMRPTGAMPIL
jgi:hypothetical protein